MLRAFYRGFPDWNDDHDEPVVEGDRVTIGWRQGGTHTGTFVLPGMSPIAATGKSVKIPEQRFFYTLNAGLISEIRPDPIPGGAPDGILQQLGVPESSVCRKLSTGAHFSPHEKSYGL